MRGSQWIPPAASRRPSLELADKTQLSAPVKSTVPRLVSPVFSQQSPPSARLSPEFEKVPLRGSLALVWHFNRLRALARWLQVYHQRVSSAPAPPLVSARCVGILQRGSTPYHMITVQQQHEWTVVSALRVAAIIGKGKEGGGSCPSPHQRFVAPAQTLFLSVTLTRTQTPHTHRITI